MLVPAPWQAGLRPGQALQDRTLQPLSGAGAAGGKTALVGLQMAVDRINKAGGINGRPVEIVVADDESKPDVGRRKTEKLWSRTRSTPMSAASSPTSASPACRCSRRTRSST
jgi:branched-chain amino acid transport system substrate-binding protein